jgi:hypothetical protein
VSVTGYCIVSSKGSSTGGLRITGLPYAMRARFKLCTAGVYMDTGISHTEQLMALGLRGTSKLM